jgi:hypothetical protein
MTYLFVIGGSVVIFRHVEVLGWMATVVDFLVSTPIIIVGYCW